MSGIERRLLAGENISHRSTSETISDPSEGVCTTAGTVGCRLRQRMRAIALDTNTYAGFKRDEVAPTWVVRTLSR